MANINSTLQQIMQMQGCVAVALVDWNVIFGQAANIATVILVCAVALLLNASGLELAAKQDIDLNQYVPKTMSA